MRYLTRLDREVRIGHTHCVVGREGGIDRTHVLGVLLFYLNSFILGCQSKKQFKLVLRTSGTTAVGCSVRNFAGFAEIASGTSDECVFLRSDTRNPWREPVAIRVASLEIQRFDPKIRAPTAALGVNLNSSPKAVYSPFVGYRYKPRFPLSHRPTDFIPTANASFNYMLDYITPGTGTGESPSSKDVDNFHGGNFARPVFSCGELVASLYTLQS